MFFYFRIATVWDIETGKSKYKLDGHAHAVCVLPTLEGIYTGSQDQHINYWVDGKKVLSFKAHDGERFIFLNQLMFRYYQTTCAHSRSWNFILFK
jgi:hypothetical protein